MDQNDYFAGDINDTSEAVRGAWIAQALSVEPGVLAPSTGHAPWRIYPHRFPQPVNY